MHRIAFVFTIIAVFLISVTAQAQTRLLCEIAHKSICENDGTCKSTPIGIWNEIDFARGTFARCDRNGCDRYPMLTEQSGLYTNVIIRPGMMAKYNHNKSDYLEIVTLGTTSYISFGSCKQIN